MRFAYSFAAASGFCLLVFTALQTQSGRAIHRALFPHHWERWVHYGEAPWMNELITSIYGATGFALFALATATFVFVRRRWMLGGMPLGGAGGMPDLPKMDPKQLEQFQKQAEQMGPGAPKLPGGLPGLGGAPFGGGKGKKR